MEVKTYTVLDRRKIQVELEAHAPINKDEIEGWCEFCPESLRQDQDECICGHAVIWYGSPLWRSIYGDPRKTENRFRLIVPDDEAGKYLMERANIVGFSNRTEAERWKRAVNFFSQGDLKDIIRFCGRKTVNRGLVSYVLNSTDKRRKDSRKKTPKKHRPAPEAGKGKPTRRE